MSNANLHFVRMPREAASAKWGLTRLPKVESEAFITKLCIVAFSLPRRSRVPRVSFCIFSQGPISKIITWLFRPVAAAKNEFLLEIPFRYSIVEIHLSRSQLTRNSQAPIFEMRPPEFWLKKIQFLYDSAGQKPCEAHSLKVKSIKSKVKIRGLLTLDFITFNLRR